MNCYECNKKTVNMVSWSYKSFSCEDCNIQYWFKSKSISFNDDDLVLIKYFFNKGEVVHHKLKCTTTIGEYIRPGNSLNLKLAQIVHQVSNVLDINKKIAERLYKQFF